MQGASRLVTPVRYPALVRCRKGAPVKGAKIKGVKEDGSVTWRPKTREFTIRKCLIQVQQIICLLGMFGLWRKLYLYYSLYETVFRMMAAQYMNPTINPYDQTG